MWGRPGEKGTDLIRSLFFCAPFEGEDDDQADEEEGDD